MVGYILMLDVKNNGNRPVTITQIDLEVTPEGSASKVFNAEYYNKILPNNPPLISYTDHT